MDHRALRRNALIRLRNQTAFHKWATIAWATLGVILSWLLRSSLVWIVFMSLWANVVGHWSAYQASRAEDAQREANEE